MIMKREKRCRQRALYMDQALTASISNSADEIDKYACVLYPNNKGLLYGSDYTLEHGPDRASAVQRNRSSIDICTRTA